MNIDEYEASQNGGQPDADISKVDFSQEEPEQEQEPAPEPEKQTEPEPEPEPEKEPEKEAEPETTLEEEKPAKRVQTPEENAKFAEQRRQQQVEQRAEQLVAERMKSSNEFKTAQLLAEMYNVPVDQLYSRLQEARIAKEAEETNAPVETVREKHQAKAEAEQSKEELNRLRTENVQTQYQLWQTRVDGEQSKLQGTYPMLSEDEFKTARNYMLQELKNPNLPLENAVYALYGQKIVAEQARIAKNEALAEISGRAKSPLPPQGGKTSSGPTLTDDERYVAKKMGISEEDYLRWK